MHALSMCIHTSIECVHTRVCVRTLRAFLHFYLSKNSFYFLKITLKSRFYEIMP